MHRDNALLITPPGIERPRRWRLLAGVGAGVILMALLAPSGLAGQASPCDPAIARNAKGGSLGYKARGDYCEGLYATDVAATPIWLASLTGAFADFDPASSPALEVSWNGPASEVVHLRAHGIKRDLYYRMDALRAADRHTWDWPTDVLASEGIRGDDIGMLGWTSERISDVDYQVLVPVNVTQGAQPPASGDSASYEMVLVPNVRLREVYVSLARVEAPGKQPTGDYIEKQQPLGRRVYPTQRPIRMRLSGFTGKGVYLVEITATRDDGRPVAMDPMWLYHPG